MATIRKLQWILYALLSLFMATNLHAQEAYLLGGGTASSLTDHSYSWALEYRQSIREDSEVSFIWLNEGHLTDNHRDGQSVQFWKRKNVFDRRLSLAVGIGPYYYFDTVTAPNRLGFADDHGLGAMFSAAAIYYLDDRWLLQLRANQIVTDNSSIDTASIQFGIGYQLDAPASRGPFSEAPAQTNRTTNNELTVFLGETIVNSLRSPSDDEAREIEYRRGLATYVDWTVGWLNEGDAKLARRNGLVTQLWAVREFLSERLALGVGIGPYFAIDDHRQPGLPITDDEEQRVSAILTASTEYRISSRWLLRLSWNRIDTDYDRDADVVLLGAGYRF